MNNQIKSYLILIPAIVLLISCSEKVTNTSATFEDLIFRYVEYWNTGNFEGIENLLSEDFELRMTPHFKPETGIEAFKESVLYWRNAYPDFFIQIDEIIFSENAAAGRWTITATNTGTGMHPPTGKSVSVPGMSIFHFSDGKIRDEWIASNNLHWLQQLGYTLEAPKDTAEGE